MRFMKMTILFLITFLIGFSFVLKNKVKKELSFEQVTEIIKKVSSSPIQISDDNEILEENNDWENGDESKFKIKLLEIGEGFHSDEVEAKTDEKWLGLFNQNGKSYLKYTNLKVFRVFDPVIDEENKKSGKTVSVEKGKSSILLLKNASFLKEGEVETFFGGNPERDEIQEDIDYLSLKVGFKKEFVIGEEKFLLSVKKGINKNGEKIIALVLENNEIKQTIHSNKYFGDDDYLGTLYWAGDLDKDGKPDFYFSLYFHDNVEYKNLFLSLRAKKGKLVEKVASFSTTGC